MRCLCEKHMNYFIHIYETGTLVKRKKPLPKQTRVWERAASGKKV